MDKPQRQEQVVSDRKRHQLERSDRSLGVFAEYAHRDEVADQSEYTDGTGHQAVDYEGEVLTVCWQSGRRIGWLRGEPVWCHRRTIVHRLIRICFEEIQRRHCEERIVSADSSCYAENGRRQHCRQPASTAR